MCDSDQGKAEHVRLVWFLRYLDAAFLQSVADVVRSAGLLLVWLWSKRRGFAVSVRYVVWSRCQRSFHCDAGKVGPWPGTLQRISVTPGLR